MRAMYEKALKRLPNVKKENKATWLKTKPFFSPFEKLNLGTLTLYLFIFITVFN
jgi:hypothetical protein